MNTNEAVGDRELASGLRPLLQWFRSIALIAQAADGGGDFTVPADRLASWIQAYDTWYKNILGVPAGRRVHLLYHRDLAIIGPQLLSLSEAVVSVASAAASAGLGCSVTLSLDDAASRPAELSKLCLAPCITSIGLVIDDQDYSIDRGVLSHILQVVVRSKKHISFICDYEQLCQLNILDHPDVCGSQVTVHPKPSFVQQARPIPRAAVLPCFGRFRLHIDAAGDIYPCFGMVGIASMRLGTVLQPISETRLARGAHALELRALALTGPRLNDSQTEQRFTGLPWACERHRDQLLIRDGERPRHAVS